MQLVPVQSENDIQAVVRLADEIWYEYYPKLISIAQITYMLQKFQSITVVREQLANAYRYFLISDHGHDLGYISVLPDNAMHSLFISKFYILKNARRQGLGKKVMAQIEQVAQAYQLDRLYLTVNKYNQAALAAYQKMGFVIVDAVQADIGAGFVMDDYKMLKNIAGRDIEV